MVEINFEAGWLWEQIALSVEELCASPHVSDEQKASFVEAKEKLESSNILRRKETA